MNNASVNMSKQLGKSSNSMAKSNVTLWKSKYNQGIPEEDKKIESDYIENLKKQAYFMEMELKLMKEREKEIEKTGGFTQLFNDDRDPSQHILQLKQKYANMKKNQENKCEDLNNKKRDVTGLNVSLKAKLDSLKKIEKEVYTKLVNLEEKSNAKLLNLESDYLIKNRDRLELEANNRLQEVELKNEIIKNQELDYSIRSGQKLDEMSQLEFDNSMALLDNLTKDKIKAYEEINSKIKELETKDADEPFYKIEIEKNAEYKKKIINQERESLEINTQVEELQVVNEFLVGKKDKTATDRKKLVLLNDELRREIEAKQQLNDIRIQKKVKENNSEEIQKLEAHLSGVQANISELEGKISKESDKKKAFTTELIALNIDLKLKEEKREATVESVDSKLKDLTQLKEHLENLKKEQLEIKDKLTKETAENLLLKNRNKILNEEFAATSEKYNFIVNNYDYTTNIKKISMDDLKNLTATNTLVNDSILNFVSKVGTFKTQNVKNLYD